MTSNLPSRAGASLGPTHFGARPATGVQVANQCGFSVSQTTCLRWATDEAAIEFQRLGLNRIALWKQRVIEFGIARTQALLRDTGLTPSSLAWTGGFTGSNGFTYEEAVDDAWTTIEMASKLGAPVVHVATGGRNSHANGHLKRIVIEALDSLKRLARDCNVTLAVHPMSAPYNESWTFLNSVSQVLDIVNELNHSNIRVGLNTYHCGLDPQFTRLMEERPEKVAALVVSDSTPGPRSENDACMIGHGTLPLSDLIGRSLRSGYDGAIELDIWGESVWQLNDYGDSIAEAIDEFAAICTRNGVST